MRINLKDKATFILVQEYVNKICNFESDADLGWNVHKLIHTFQVVQMAQRLIDRTHPPMPQQIQKHILNAALLHDIGRCHEFKNGKHLKVDHGKIGAALINKYLPKMNIETESTLFHNKPPSNQDPKSCKLVLDYVRDADMLANLDYQIKHSDIWLKHLLVCFSQEPSDLKIDPEIPCAVKEHRCASTKNIKHPTLINMLLQQLCWYYILQTDAAKQIVLTENLFIRSRDMICDKILSKITTNKKQQLALIREIKQIFRDDLFK